MPSTNANTIVFPAVPPPTSFGGYSNPYDVKFKGRWGWTRSITLRDEYRLFKLIPQFAHWTKQDHIRASELSRTIAEMHLATRNALSAFGSQIYGMNGPLISGGFHDDWPNELKDRLRSLSWQVTRQSDISLSHWRAAGRTTKTWRKEQGR